MVPSGSIDLNKKVVFYYYSLRSEIMYSFFFLFSALSQSAEDEGRRPMGERELFITDIVGIFLSRKTKVCVI